MQNAIKKDQWCLDELYRCFLREEIVKSFFYQLCPLFGFFFEMQRFLCVGDSSN